MTKTKRKPQAPVRSTRLVRHVLWHGALTASEGCPWYYESATYQGFSRDEPNTPGMRYRREWPRVGSWKRIAPNHVLGDANPEAK